MANSQTPIPFQRRSIFTFTVNYWDHIQWKLTPARQKNNVVVLQWTDSQVVHHQLAARMTISLSPWACLLKNIYSSKGYSKCTAKMRKMFLLGMCSDIPDSIGPRLHYAYCIDISTCTLKAELIPNQSKSFQSPPTWLAEICLGYDEDRINYLL